VTATDEVVVDAGAGTVVLVTTGLVVLVLVGLVAGCVDLEVAADVAREWTARGRTPPACREGLDCMPTTTAAMRTAARKTIMTRAGVTSASQGSLGRHDVRLARRFASACEKGPVSALIGPRTAVWLDA
jgi:hypothetical protein